MDDGIFELISRGRTAAKVGDIEEAHHYLEWALRQVSIASPEWLEAIYWLSKISTDPQQKRDYLTDILAVEPSNARARYDLAVLDGKIDPARKVDPDRIQQIPRPDKIALTGDETERMTCPNCGGRLVYTPDGISLTCEYCASREKIDAGAGETAAKQVEEDFIVSMATPNGHLNPIAAQEAVCQGCGATFISAPGNLTFNCPYCDAVYVIQPNESRQIIPPSELIPFTYSAREALRRLQAWLAEKHILSESTIALPQSLYTPVWVFNMGGQVSWTGIQETRNAKKIITGTFPVINRDVMVPASRHLKEKIKHQLPKYEITQLVPFDPRYMFSWLAETYNIPLADASLEAREMTFNEAKIEINALYGTNLDDLQFSSAGLTVDTYRLILLPIWIAHYMDDGTRVEVIINGQTSAVEAVNAPRGAQSWFMKLFDND